MMEKKQNNKSKQDNNMVMLCIYIGLAFVLTILAIYFLTKYLL